MGLPEKGRKRNEKRWKSWQKKDFYLQKKNKENNVDDNNLDGDTDTDDKEKTPELMIPSLHQDSGIEVNSQSSESNSSQHPVPVVINKTSNSSNSSSSNSNTIISSSSSSSNNNTRLIEAEQPPIKEE